jgi:hypothetical protein
LPVSFAPGGLAARKLGLKRYQADRRALLDGDGHSCFLLPEVVEQWSHGAV